MAEAGRGSRKRGDPPSARLVSAPLTRVPLLSTPQDALIAGTVRRFAVLVLDQTGLVVERFVAALAVSEMERGWMESARCQHPPRSTL